MITHGNHRYVDKALSDSATRGLAVSNKQGWVVTRLDGGNIDVAEAADDYVDYIKTTDVNSIPFLTVDGLRVNEKMAALTTTLNPSRITPTAYSTVAGERLIKQSINTRSRYQIGYNGLPDFGGLINVTDQGVNGVTIKDGASRLSLSRMFEKVDEAYVRSIESLVFTVNISPFWGRDAGEVLFQGVTAKETPQNWVEIVYQFLIKANIRGGFLHGLTNFDADGHDYVWTYEKEMLVYDPDAQVVRKPVAVYVEQVYYYRDFSALGLTDENAQPVENGGA